MEGEMKKLWLVALSCLAIVPLLAACQESPVAAEPEVLLEASLMPGQACWGQASAVYAQMGEMGLHSSQQPNPRLGLRNLARALFEQGAIPDDSMEALGVFVATALGLSIDACGT
jgi:hypothetical protein